jgi:hypothetical protein
VRCVELCVRFPKRGATAYEVVNPEELVGAEGPNPHLALPLEAVIDSQVRLDRHRPQEAVVAAILLQGRPHQQLGAVHHHRNSHRFHHIDALHHLRAMKKTNVVYENSR